MKVARWGNSLAVRIPADVVGTMGLKEGDHVEVILKHTDGFEDNLDKLDQMNQLARRNAALTRMDARRWVLPPNWKIDRDDPFERG